MNHSVGGCINSIIKGRATVDGTKFFVSQAKLNLHHVFHSCKLFINPIIHGPPIGLSKGVGSNETIDHYLKIALQRNKSNCIYVYNRSVDNVWHSDPSHLRSLFTDNFEREQVVFIAGLGQLNSPEVISNNLSDALSRCNIEKMDIAIIECDDQSFEQDSHYFEPVISFLEQLVRGQYLHTYGFRVSTSPYTFHTPTPARVGAHTIAHIMLEDKVPSTMPSLELMLYPISPSSAIPASYPFLEVVPANITGSVSAEKERLFTRGAVNPLLCYPGVVPAVDEEDEYDFKSVCPGGSHQLGGVDESKCVRLISGLLGEEFETAIGQVLDELCPKLASTPTLQAKAIRAVLSVGVEVLVLDAASSAAIGKLQLTAKDLLCSQDTDDLFGTFMVPDVSTVPIKSN